MIRPGTKTRQSISDNLDRWYAAQWRAVRDERLSAARIEQNQLKRRALVHCARRAHGFFLRHLFGSVPA